MKNTEKKSGDRSISKRSEDLKNALNEGRQKYGDDYLVINKGTEYKPNWVAVKHPNKGNAGIKGASWERNPIKVK
ncbi:DUF4148 domain-containing protein [Bacillus thuringiensis]|uniref:DUF4148 domain-containing protein n=1 Tax=Bacillus wiedmannii TaxID=1890302 RepID=UPI002E22733B|nr:DUF4148 domain-containing protein [Bacillus wiedmannii]MED2760459.1 DUF4148 domain-containing protein [Bacillus thuringiensis]MED2789212.1 DUF4148 domain-containing protein [Bacillus thuringiensis]MED2828959.1 DUF4148 domain-containing protein [Bacillus thuringiensis]MED2856418.1 DUF4148 domain-containing protein [Bacillus thuringiensis]MED2863670.1 DUF4148 domain-containing protein [Bacillus thuringiensis]